MAPPLPSSQFVFALCQPGAEGALKLGVGRVHPELRLAYSRPGLVTFKAPAPVAPDVELDSVFARVWGASRGAVDGVNAVVEAARVMGRKVRLHAVDRASGDVAIAARDAVLEAGEGAFLEGEAARSGDLVFDLLVAEGEPLWLGCHLHGGRHGPLPGGVLRVEPPAEAPSRAYAKLEEALAWSGLPVRGGEHAVEIGSSPGGAAYALLRRGVHVIGVDPGEMDPVVSAYVGPGGARLTHLPTTLAAVRTEEFGSRADWLLMDVHLAPQVALHQVRRLVSALRPTLRGVIFTLKLNDPRIAEEIPDLLRRVEAMAITGVRAIQLPSNRQEICVVGRMRR